MKPLEALAACVGGIAECHRLGFVYKDERGLITTQPGRMTAGTLPLPATFSSKTQLGRTLIVPSIVRASIRLTGARLDVSRAGHGPSTLSV